ncbi:hypothetical protein AALC17_21145 [Oscillospiraceae bacterium 38-13]
MKNLLMETKAELTEAYSLLSLITVRGDDVDRLSESRQRIRKVFHTAKIALEALEKEEAHGGAGKAD